MIAELHDSRIASQIREHSLMYGDFIMTNGRSTRHFVTLHSVCNRPTFAEALVDAVKGLANVANGKTPPTLSKPLDAVYGISNSPESVILALRMAEKLGIGFGFAEPPQRHPVSHIMATNDFCVRPLRPGDHVLVVADVAVTGRTVSQICVQMALSGATAIPFIVAARGSFEELSGALAGFDSIICCDSSDLAIQVGEPNGPMDDGLLAAQRERLVREGWLLPSYERKPSVT